MASVKLEHIYKVYPNGTKAVSDFTMDIKDGEFIVFVGPSGCGKSTTLRMIAGLEEITDGELYINDKLMNELCIYGAFEENKLIGIMGTKNEGKHISLFFIKKEFHRKGIGKQLFDYSQCDCPANEITVNSSTYAIRFYESLGFEKTNDRQQTNGISYTPMKLISNK